MLASDDEAAPLKAIDFGLAVPFDPAALPVTELGLEGTPWCAGALMAWVRVRDKGTQDFPRGLEGTPWCAGPLWCDCTCRGHFHTIGVPGHICTDMGYSWVITHCGIFPDMLLASGCFVRSDCALCMLSVAVRAMHSWVCTCTRLCAVVAACAACQHTAARVQVHGARGAELPGGARVRHLVRGRHGAPAPGAARMASSFSGANTGPGMAPSFLQWKRLC